MAATREMYLDASGNVIKGASTRGYRAAGVPGPVAGLVLAHKRHGSMKWADLVEPARRLAAEGFRVDYALARSLSEKDTIEKLRPFPQSRRLFQRDGKFY